jgi:excisionase family DNA binding protein
MGFRDGLEWPGNVRWPDQIRPVDSGRFRTLLSGVIHKLPVVLGSDREEFLNARAAAERLGVSDKTIRRWIAAGELKAIKRGRAFVIPLAALERFLPQAAASGQGNRARHVAEVDLLRDQLAELRGRYAEAARRIQDLEGSLREEIRRSAELEARISLQAA